MTHLGFTEGSHLFWGSMVSNAKAEVPQTLARAYFADRNRLRDSRYKAGGGTDGRDCTEAG
jgi:hypothetical protein